MPTTVNVYSVLRQGSQWRVTRGRGCTLKLFDSNEEAVAFGVKMARKCPPSQLAIYREDGTTEAARSYVGDPFPLVELSL